MNSPWITRGTWALLVIALLAQSAQGDGGKIQVSRRVGPYRVTIFTMPTPLRVGQADISVMVQDPETDEVAGDVAVNVCLRTPDGKNLSKSYQATRGQATNKLLYAVPVEFPSPGRWTVSVDAKGPPGAGQLEFTADVLETPPPWRERLPWIAWPLLPIGLFALREIAEHLNTLQR